MADQASTSASYKPVVVREDVDSAAEEYRPLEQSEHMYEALDTLDISEWTCPPSKVGFISNSVQDSWCCVEDSCVVLKIAVLC